MIEGQNVCNVNITYDLNYVSTQLFHTKCQCKIIILSFFFLDLNCHARKNPGYKITWLKDHIKNVYRKCIEQPNSTLSKG